MFRIIMQINSALVLSLMIHCDSTSLPFSALRARADIVVDVGVEGVRLMAPDGPGRQASSPVRRGGVLIVLIGTKSASWSGPLYGFTEKADRESVSRCWHCS